MYAISYLLEGYFVNVTLLSSFALQWGTTYAEIKVTSVENPGLRKVLCV